jgi:hypothetical protein
MADAFCPVFLMGCPRSGTTLLSAILDRHSQFAATPETHFFQLSYLAKPGSSDRDELVRLFCDNPRAADCGLEEAELSQALQEDEATHAGALRAALRLFARKQGKSNVVEKTPDNLPFTLTGGTSSCRSSGPSGRTTTFTCIACIGGTTRAWPISTANSIRSSFISFAMKSCSQIRRPR